MSSAAAPADPRKAVLVDSRTISWHGETWSLEKKLGSGRFASVYEMHCSTNPSKEKVAAKVTQLAGITPWARSQINEELAIWQTLKHPNVVRLHGHVTNESQHVLLLELAQGGELFDRIVTMQFFSEQLAARQVGQVLSALEYLHSFGVLHRDLKPENLLLESAADDAKVKIADFGASKLVISCGAKTPCGSLGYAAPEQLRGLKFAQDPAHVPPYDKEVDIWSVGVITYILLSGSMPFDPASYSVESISRSGSLEFPSSLFGEVSAEALDFIRSLLQVDPAKRLTAASALRHPWVVAELEEAPKSASKRAGRWGAGLLSAGASSSLPTPSTDAKQPTSALRSTPLPTPRRLKMLQESGQLRSNWDRATKPAAAHDGDENREGAQKRTAVELENDEKRGADEDVPLVMLPEEVTKKIRRYSSDSSHLSSQASNESARSARVAGGDSAASQQ